MALFPKPYTYFVETLGQDADKDDVWTASGQVSFDANIEPETNEKVTQKHDGKDFGGFVRIFADIELPIIGKNQKDKRAIVQYDGENWEVVGRENFNGTTLPHNEYVAGMR